MIQNQFVENQESAVKQYFNDLAQDWHDIYSNQDLHSIMIQERLEKVLKFVTDLKLPKGAKILDVGCGAGITATHLLKMGYNVDGIDVAEDMIVLAQKNCDDLNLPDASYNFRLGNTENLDIKDDTYDCIIAMGLIEYLRDDTKALVEMRRVTRTGGHLIVTVPNKRRISYLLDPVQWTKGILGAIVGSKLFHSFRHSKLGARLFFSLYDRTQYVPAQLVQKLEELGWTKKDDVSVGFGPFRIISNFKGFSKKLNARIRRLNESSNKGYFHRKGSSYLVLCQKS